MILRLLLAITVALPLAGPARAQSATQTPAQPPVVTMQETEALAALSEALMIGPVLEVMRQEGMDYGRTLEDELFAGSGGPRWQAVVGLIYDPTAMKAEFDAVMAKELAGDPDAVAAMTAFFADPRGQQILTLEIEARRALLDPATEELARETVADMRDRDDPRLALLRDFAEVNGLIESNVAGALNANLAFFKGMSEGGAFGDAMPESDMLADVWAQEPDIRAETEDWLYPYLALSYGPLPDADLRAYLDFSKTPEGQKLNAAVFAAFDRVFTRISYDLGAAAARQMQGEDI